MSRHLRVYLASKLHHAELALELREKWPTLHFTARWPLMHGKIPDEPRWAGQFWQDDFDDIWRANVLVLWAEPQDKLRGALVEAGIAIALRKQVVVAGEHPDFGTWQYHPFVVRQPSLDLALAYCRDNTQALLRL